MEEMVVFVAFLIGYGCAAFIGMVTVISPQKEQIKRMKLAFGEHQRLLANYNGLKKENEYLREKLRQQTPIIEAGNSEKLFLENRKLRKELKAANEYTRSIRAAWQEQMVNNMTGK